MKSLFKGSYVAIITPFKKNGKMDRKALEKHVAWQMEQGSDGILGCGATGEGIVLSDTEKLQVASICVSVAEKKIPILMGSGSASTSQTAQLTEKMGKLGVAGCLVVTPYYNRPTGRGCLAHYKEVAKTGVPIIPYYNPKRTATFLTPEVFAEIAMISGVAALKDSSGDIDFIKRVHSLTKTPILSGDDDMTYETLKAGGVGAISVIGNAFPRQWKEMIDFALLGKWSEAKRLNDRYMPLCKAMFIESNPQCIKWLSHWMGLVPSYMRLPLLVPEESTKKKIKGTLVRMGLPFFQFYSSASKTA